MKKFSKEHEWVQAEGDKARVGITKYAAQQLGDVVFIELPEVGDRVSSGDRLAVVESVKAASDVFVPFGGEVLEVNEALADAPEMLNKDPEGEAWIAVLSLQNPAELDNLLDEEAYQAFVAKGGH